MSLHPPAPEPAEQTIQHAAYLLWEQAGRPAGRDLEFWVTAREQLRHTVPAHSRWPWARPATLITRNAQPPGRNCR